MVGMGVTPVAPMPRPPVALMPRPPVAPAVACTGVGRGGRWVRATGTARISRPGGETESYSGAAHSSAVTVVVVRPDGLATEGGLDEPRRSVRLMVRLDGIRSVASRLAAMPRPSRRDDDGATATPNEEERSRDGPPRSGAVLQPSEGEQPMG